MQKIWFITYADKNYSAQQQKLENVARGCGVFDHVVSYNDGTLKSDNRFYHANKELIEAMPIGDDGRVKPSFFLFKPYIIHHALNVMPVGDILMYIDCGDSLTDTDTLRDFLTKKTKNIDMILTAGAFTNKQYCRMDAFFYTGSNSKKYYDAVQVEAGIFVAKKTSFTQNVVNKWLKFCCDRRIISDDKNTCGIDNFPEFVWHRWDQSVISILSVKHDIYRSSEMRKYVICNSND